MRAGSSAVRQSTLSPSDMATAVLQRFYAALLSWKSLPQGTLPQEVITTTCDCLKDILKVRDKLHGVATQQGNRFRLIPLTPPPPKEAGEETTRQVGHEAWGGCLNLPGASLGGDR